MDLTVAYRIRISLISALFLLSGYGTVMSQMPRLVSDQPSVTGWADDNHYFFRTKDAEGNTIFYNTDARNGKQTPASQPISARDILTGSLPSGVTATMSDEFNDVSNSIILNRDNDLYVFRKGFTSLRRLTDSKDPELNVKFSPDGMKIAYTRNKDLYVCDLASFAETRLTFDAGDRIYNGYAAWVYY